MKYSKYIKFFDFNPVNWWVAIVPSILLLIGVILGDGIIHRAIIVMIFLSIFLLLIQSLISYPFRYVKIRRFVKNGKCFTRKAAGTVLGCYVFNGKTESLNLNHDWNLCRGQCMRCWQSCNEQHDWDGCKCKRCGKTRDEQHEWDGCKCTQCGKTRDEQHEWNCCECTRCGKIMYEMLDSDCKCKNCGKDRHDWEIIEVEDWQFYYNSPGGGTTTTYKCKLSGIVKVINSHCGEITV